MEKSEKKKNTAPRMEDGIIGDTDNEREEEEVDQLDSGEVSDSTLKNKGEDLLFTSCASC